MNKTPLIALLIGLSLILIFILPSCSSGTATPATSEPISISKTPSGPATLKSIESLLAGMAIRVRTTKQLEITAIYTNGTSKAVTDKCTFKSSDVQVATVSGSGLVTAVYDGTCNITVSYSENGISQTASVSVKVYSEIMG
jgi:uncharacterized protein YjdB